MTPQRRLGQHRVTDAARRRRDLSVAVECAIDDDATSVSMDAVRLILVAALAYVLLVAIGLWCRDHLDPRWWCTNRRRRELSAFAIARAMRDRDTPRCDRLIDHLLVALLPQAENWG